jgi:hypothetical protein
MRSNLANDSRHVLPHAASLSFDSRTLACAGNVLTGKAPRNHVNKSSPWLPVKGLNVIPDRERVEASIVLPGDQNVPCVGVPFDCANGSPSKEFSAEYSATSACEKCQLIHLVG